VHYNPLMELRDYSEAGCYEYHSSGPPCKDPKEEHSLDEEEETENVEESDLEMLFTADVETSAAFSIPAEQEKWCSFHQHTHLASLMVQVGDRSYCALLDTGAQVSCITTRVVEEQHQLLEVDRDDTYRISGLGQHSFSLCGSVLVELRSPTGLMVGTDHKLAVVQNEMMPFCLILGIDFLREHQLELDFASSTIKKQGAPLRKMDPVADGPLLSCILVVEDHWGPSVRTICVGSYDRSMTFALKRDQQMCVSGLVSLVDRGEVLKLQKCCPVLSVLKRNIQSPPDQWPPQISRFRRYKNQLAVRDGMVEHTKDKTVVVVPFEFLVEFTLVLHHKMLHLGRQKLIDMALEYVWHPSLSKVAADVTRTCDRCQRMKVTPILAPPVHAIQTTHPFELVAMDLLALPRCQGFIACLVIMDHNSKWLAVVPLSSKTSEAVAKGFEYDVLPTLPLKPRRVLTDNGSEFVGAAFESVLEKYGIVHQLTTPYHPSSNGLVERANRTLLQLLRVGDPECTQWRRALPEAVMVHNHSLHSALQMAPAEYLLQKEHQVVDRTIFPVQTREMWSEGHPSFGTFKLGQLVLKKVVLRGHETTNKFKPRFEGPYSVVTVHQNGVTYEMQRVDDQQVIRAHHSQLKRYLIPPNYLSEHPYFKLINGRVEDDIPVVPVEIAPGRLITSAYYSSDSSSGVSDSEESLSEESLSDESDSSLGGSSSDESDQGHGYSSSRVVIEAPTDDLSDTRSSISFRGFALPNASQQTRDDAALPIPAPSDAETPEDMVEEVPAAAAPPNNSTSLFSGIDSDDPATCNKPKIQLIQAVLGAGDSINEGSMEQTVSDESSEGVNSSNLPQCSLSLQDTGESDLPAQEMDPMRSDFYKLEFMDFEQADPKLEAEVLERNNPELLPNPALNFSEDFWEFSDTDHDPYHQEVQKVKATCLSLLDECLEDITNKVSAVREVLSSSSAFSGFGEANSGGSRNSPILEKLQGIERMIAALNRGAQLSTTSSSNKSVSGHSSSPMTQRRKTVTLRQRRDRLQGHLRRRGLPADATPRRTRSQGTVPDLPRVQPRILEYNL
jgi:hypothetical protein